jgi:hypothetical protein
MKQDREHLRNLWTRARGYLRQAGCAENILIHVDRGLWYVVPGDGNALRLANCIEAAEATYGSGAADPSPLHEAVCFCLEALRKSNVESSAETRR